MISRLRREPVAFFGGLNTLWLATITLANSFSWWEWSDDQTVAITGIWTALSALITYLVRGEVTPTTPPA